ncbi:MAG: SUMF1/EgtB/PvdO family nonheme iron enzyme, partial [Planctomycetota bacterium]
MKTPAMKSLLLAALAVLIGQTAGSASDETPECTAKKLDVPSSWLRLLPDVLAAPDGGRIATVEQWNERRREIEQMILYHQYGRVPPRPDQVAAELQWRKPHPSGKGVEERVTLVIGSQRKLRMRAALYVPNKPPPYPVVVREEGTLGRTREIPLFLDKGYLFIEYARHDLDPDRQGVDGPAQAAYPDFDWATLAVWAWGGSRVVDYLESRDDVDLSHIAITGHSRGGKMAMLAGALDERFTLVVPNGSGAGGAGSYRILGPGAESLGMNDKPHWYHVRIREFAEREHRLPFDQHFLKAMVAPRALLCTESLDDAFANPLGSQLTSMAANEVYDLLRADRRKNGLHFRRGEHDSTTADWQALLDFAEWHFFGREPSDPTRFWQVPLPSPEPEEGLANQDDPPSRRRSDDPSAYSVAEVEDSGVANKVEFAFISIDAPGNDADEDHFGSGQYGGVAYPFQIAKRQVTNAQYAAFLNAVARSDPRRLYHAAMAEEPGGGIERSGPKGQRQYDVKTGMDDRPATLVSWQAAARFCNWMHNGQPVGSAGEEATEEGAYALDGIDSNVARSAQAKYFLPSEDEWYKAAY